MNEELEKFQRHRLEKLEADLKRGLKERWDSLEGLKLWGGVLELEAKQCLREKKMGRVRIYNQIFRDIDSRIAYLNVSIMEETIEHFGVF